jgi:hypothetical protein
MPAEAAEQFTIRTYQPGDETAILELFGRSFHAPRSLEHWRWKYEQNPYGAGRISMAFSSDGRLVSHYAGYPFRFYAFGKDLEVNHVGDTMTDPSIRHIGRGATSLLGRTAMHFYETFCDGKVAFNIGFNSAGIQRFSLRLPRSAQVEPIAYRAVDAARLRKLTRLERWAHGYQFELVDDAGEEWDTLFARVAPAYRFLARRDAQYVRWRYLSAPDVTYVTVALRKWRRLVGWLVFRIRANRLSIGDLLVDPAHTDAIDLVVRHLAALYPVEKIDGWFPDRPVWLAESLGKTGFRPQAEPQGLSLLSLPFWWEEAPQEMRLSLYYTMGDSDLF